MREDPAHWRDMQIRLEGPAVTPLQTGFAQNWLQTTGELISGPLFYPPHWTPAGPLAVQTIMSSPEIGASTVRMMYYLSIICARQSIYIANPYFVPDEAAIDALVDAQSAAWTCASWCPAFATTTGWRARTAFVCSARCSRAGIDILEYNRTMLHHKTMVVDARVGDDRDDQLRQSIVRAQRREQRLLLRARVRAIAPRDVRGRHRGLRSGGAGGVEAPRPLAADAGSVRGIPRRTDLTRVVRRGADPTSL